MAQARTSPRRRIILPLHRSQDALVQRMLNCMLTGTYIQPHLHPLPHASETIQVLRGSMDFLIFDSAGNITERHKLSEGIHGLIDIEPRVWHGFVVTSEECVVLEIKRGPYDPTADKVFAEWAPPENSPEVETYLRRLSERPSL